MIFGPSQKLNGKIKMGTLPVLPLNDNPLADWSAALFVVGRTQYILLSNTRSRHEIGKIPRAPGVETVEFRARMVVGAGSLSYRLLKSLTDRLPVLICPRWLSTATQPIAVDDVLAYLLAARELPTGVSRTSEIGGSEVVTYADLVREYARQTGLRRWLAFVPVPTPYLSGLWLALVTPATYEVGRHLTEGLENPTVVRDGTALEVFPVRPMGVTEAIRRAIAGTTA